MRVNLHRPWSAWEPGKTIGEFTEDIKGKTAHFADLAKEKTRSAYLDTKHVVKKAAAKTRKFYENGRSKLLKSH